MAAITKEFLNDLFKTYSAAFNKAYNAAPDPSDKETLRVEDFAMLVQSAGAATDHTWLGQLPAMREWVGSRVLNDLDLGKITVVNREFEDTVHIKRTAIEDDNFGAFSNLVEALGIAARDLWRQLAIKAMLDNGVWADGKKFFASGRTIGEGDNAATITNGVTTAFSASAVEAAIAAMRGWKLGGGRVAGVRPKLLVVGPQNLAAARRVCNSELVATAAGTATESNPLRGLLQYRVCDEIDGGAWYLFGEVGNIRAVAVQKRKEPTLVRKDRDEDDNVFMQGEYYYGADARGEGFLTLPFLAYAGGMAEVPSAAEG